MFRVEPTPTPQPLGRLDLWVIDHERDASLVRITGMAHSRYSKMKLVWQDRVIGFQLADAEGRNDPVTGARFILMDLRYFGPSVSDREYGSGMSFYRFADDEERREARLLAIEASLIFGAIYNGEERPDGWYRIEFEGHMYRKSDFGYR